MENNSDASNEDYLIALSEQHSAGGFPYKLAMAIVKAHPSSGTDTEQMRINKALKALLGDDYNAILKRTNLRDALKYMAREYIADRGGDRMSLGRDPFSWLEKSPDGVRTKEDLAIEANKKIQGAPSAQHLENVFGKDTRRICQSLIYASDIPGSLHQQALKSIQTIVEPLGIKLLLDE